MNMKYTMQWLVKPAVYAGLVCAACFSTGCAAIAGLEDERSEGPAKLVGDQRYPTEIAVKGDFVYWVTAVPRDQNLNETRAIRRILRTGEGVPAVLHATDLSRASALTIDDAHVYWYERKDPEDVGDCGAEKPDGLRRLPISGGDPESLMDDCFWDQGITLANDSSRLYVAGEDWDWVASIDKADKSMRKDIASGEPNARGVIVDGKNVYWATFHSGGGNRDTSRDVIRRFDKSTADSPVIDTVGRSIGSAPEWLAQDDQYLYWTTFDGRVYKVKKDAANDTDGTEIATGLEQPSAIAVDDQHVYVADREAGRIVRMNKDGSGFKAVAENQGTPYRMAIDDVAIYWTNRAAGQVMVLRKE